MNEVADKRSCRLWLAFAYALMSAWAGASVSLLIKFVKESGVDQILMTQWCVQYFLLLPVITYKRQISIKDNRTANILLFVRAAAGVSSSSVLYYSFKLISVGDATAIVSTYIALVGFLSCILLKEPCGALHIVLSLLALVGLVFVAQPTFLFGATQEASQDANRPLGILMACLGAVLGAVALISVRKMGAVSSRITLILKSSDASIPRSYSLPKIHKDVQLRPIESFIDSESWFISTCPTLRGKHYPQKFGITTVLAHQIPLWELIWR